MADQIYHVEVVGKDGPALQQFFSELFGWHFDIVPSGYGFVAREEAGVAVGVGKAEDGSAGWVTAYINVPDITATLARVTELGGQIVAPRFSPAPGAVLGLFTDPEGHLVGLTEV